MMRLNINRRRGDIIVDIIDNALYDLAKSIIYILICLYLFIIVIILKYLITFSYINLKMST
jgi:hypothetical protein